MREHLAVESTRTNRNSKQ